MGSERIGGGLITPINLRTVPPVGVSVQIGGWGVRFLRKASGIGRSALDAHRVFWPIVIRVQRDLKFISRFRSLVGKPVVGLKLDPGSRQQVEGFRRAEAFAGQ